MARKKASSVKKKPATTKVATPAAEKAASVEEKAISAVTETAPTEEKKEPAAKETVSAEKKTAPAAEKAAPAEEKKVSAVKETVPAAEKTAVAAEKAASPEEKKELPVKKTVSAKEKTVPAAPEAPPVEEKKKTPAKKTAPAKEKMDPAAAKTTPAEGKKRTSAKKAASAEEKAVSAAAKAVPAKGKKRTSAKKAAPVEEKSAPAAVEAASAVEEVSAVNVMSNLPRRSVAFIGSECHPFVKTGGLGDVMYALPRELVRLNCDVRVILPRYACIPQKYQDQMVYRGEFYMDLGKTGRNYYVGIMEYVCDGVVYDFIDNQEFFSSGNPYLNLVDDIPKYCFFSKAALAALNYLNWIPDIVHCHDWQAALVPVYLRTLFQDSPIGHARSILTIHNLRFQGIYNIPTIQYWSGLPDSVFGMGALKENYVDANMLKGGLAYADRITTVSGT